MLRPPLPRRGQRNRMLAARLILAEPRVWPAPPGVCPLCTLTDPAPSLASRYRGDAPAHVTCVARAFPAPPPLSDLGLRQGRPVPAFGWRYVAHIDATADGIAYATTLAACKPGRIRTGSVLVVARRFAEVEEAVVYTGEPLDRNATFRVPLTCGLTLGQGEWGRIYIRRMRGA